MDKRIIVSVPSSGTRFLMYHLGVYAVAHTSWDWDRLLQLVEGRIVIVALREPRAVWRTWCHRNDGNLSDATFILAWQQLQRLESMMQLDVICVDKQQDSRITDWTPVGKNRYSPPVIPIDLQGVYELPIVQRNYPEEKFPDNH